MQFEYKSLSCTLVRPLVPAAAWLLLRRSKETFQKVRVWLHELGWHQFAGILARLLNTIKINFTISWQPGQSGKLRSRYRGAGSQLTGLRFFHANVLFRQPGLLALLHTKIKLTLVSPAVHYISHQLGWLALCNTGLKVILANRSSPGNWVGQPSSCKLMP